MFSILYVSSPVNALVQGILREDKTLKQILAHGNFGLGTFNDLDGEMVLVDDIFYQLRSDGSVIIPDLDIGTPYACVTKFESINPLLITQKLNYAGLQELITKQMLSTNLVYAIRIEGAFSGIRARSVPRQESYRPLVDVAGDQKEFNFDAIDGQLVGFWTPEFMHSITVPGFHLHFISSDKKHGGHLLDCMIDDVKVWLQPIDEVSLSLPHTIEYLNAKLNFDNSADINKAEH